MNLEFHTYECGFDAYGSINYRYDIRFYLIGILFLLFDLELLYLYPLILYYNIYIYIYALIFLLILVIGLIYEYTFSSIDIWYLIKI